LLSASTAFLLRTLHDELDPLEDIQAEIQRVLVNEPRVLAKEGGIIQDGISTELDELRTIQNDGSGWLARFEQQERERANIPNLRVGFNRVFGYYLEVTKSYLHLVPKSYTRRQTLVHAERFITRELQRFEEKVLSAAERGKALEYELFARLREQVAAQANRLRQTATVLGTLDVLCSLAEIAARKNWVRPEVSEHYEIRITEGRHPVVETLTGSFVPNDLHLDEQQHLLLLTGPNAAGKSTYARQAALLVLLAQVGSFLPAEAATVGVVDRIFTRVGAMDFLARRLSTFMVEMMETANILRHATAKSLVILDEVGRGTGTSDGQAIAHAVAEVLAQEVKAKTIFTTHYHELAQLAETISGVVNARLEVRENQDEVTFLYKVVPGAAQKSYGLYVAKLAGLPSHVVQRAGGLLADWEQEKEKKAVGWIEPFDEVYPEHSRRTQDRLRETQQVDSLIERLSNVDPLHTTPMEALLLLAELKKLAEH
jgi:DNA mismatch repair protein MutS